MQRGPFQSAYVGYWIDEAKAGHGYTPEAVVVLARFCFEDLRLHRIQIAIIPRNRASRRVVEKLGIREEGIAVRYLEINGVVGGPRPLRHHRRGVGGAGPRAQPGAGSSLDASGRRSRRRLTPAPRSQA